MLYQVLLKEVVQQNVEVCEKPLMPSIKGLYGDNTIWLNRGLASNIEKVCVLAEEMGHYYTSSGYILNQKQLINLKQEKRARNWAFEKLIPLQNFIEAAREGVSNRYELAEFLDVTGEFLDKSIEHYREKFGLYTVWKDYLIYFDPLRVLKLFKG